MKGSSDMYDPYCLTNDELIKKFMNTCGRAGTANSGLVIDFAGPSLASAAHYLKGIVWSRMDSEIPPFRPGMSVQRKDENEVIADSYAGSIKTSNPLLIEEVHYFGKGKWRLVFVDTSPQSRHKETSKAFYNTDAFELTVPEEVTACQSLNS